MSSSDIAISIEDVSKAYTIWQKGQRHITLAEAALARIRHPFQRSSGQTFWALKDITLDIKRGEVVGLIGRNGAGKSTLLKILSRITEPTTGKVDLYGRVGSLLEVGTGFHPELTGRENIFLNGAILGMTKAEIARQFDAIVDFSGVEQFLDTPVKRYSSGMYVRLAFAVAAHLESEILIVDEVLAVGDAQFQRKCLTKMGDVAGSGRTVLFVSHSMESINTLCTSALFLESGQVRCFGPTRRAIDAFRSAVTANPIEADRHRKGSGELRVTSVSTSKPSFECAETKRLTIGIKRMTDFRGSADLLVIVRNDMNVAICQCDSRLVDADISVPDEVEVELTIDQPWFRPGEYRVDIVIARGSAIDELYNACTLNIAPILPYSTIASSHAIEHGLIFADFKMRVTPTTAPANTDVQIPRVT